MTKESLNRQEVSAVFVQVGAKRVPEGMAGDAWFPSKEPFLFMDVP